MLQERWEVSNLNKGTKLEERVGPCWEDGGQCLQSNDLVLAMDKKKWDQKQNRLKQKKERTKCHEQDNLMLSNLLGHQSKSWTFSSWTVVLHRRSISMFTKGNPRHDNYNPWGRALISSPSQLRTCFHFFPKTKTCVLWVPVFRQSTNCVEEFGLHSIEKCRSKLPLAGLWSVVESFGVLMLEESVTSQQSG